MVKLRASFVILLHRVLSCRLQKQRTAATSTVPPSKRAHLIHPPLSYFFIKNGGFYFDKYKPPNDCLICKRSHFDGILQEFCNKQRCTDAASVPFIR